VTPLPGRAGRCNLDFGPGRGECFAFNLGFRSFIGLIPGCMGSRRCELQRPHGQATSHCSGLRKGSLGNQIYPGLLLRFSRTNTQLIKSPH